MRRLLVVCLAVLASVIAASAQDAVPATAQDNVVSFADSSASGAAPAATPQRYGRPEYPDWQVSIGLGFSGFRLHDQNAINPNNTFHVVGINGSVVRYFKDWFGVEGAVATGFGNTGNVTTPNNLSVKTVFLGGGAHIAYRSDSRWEPFGHALVGMEHFRFAQTAGILGGNSSFAYMLGAGVGYHFLPRMSVRGEGDFLGTRLFHQNQRNYQIVGAFVLDF